MVVMDQLCIDVDERVNFGSCFVDPEQRAPFDVERICCHSDFSHLILFLPAALPAKISSHPTLSPSRKQTTHVFLNTASRTTMLGN